LTVVHIVGITNSKHRNAIGLLGIDVDVEKKIITVAFARQWSRKEIAKIPRIIAGLYHGLQWDSTYIDLAIGLHFIKEMRLYGAPSHIITTQKNLKDTNEIEQIRTMDKTEMVQYTMMLLQKLKLMFSPDDTPTMRKLMKQFAIFNEKKTEAGNVDYYAPGNELDSLVKALLVACFAARKYMGSSGTRAIGGKVAGEQLVDDGGIPVRTVGRAMGSLSGNSFYSGI